MSCHRIFMDKTKLNKIIVAILTFSLSYVIPIIVQIIVFGCINKSKLNNIVIWGEIFEASGLLWAVTTVLIIALYNYRVRCLSDEKREPNKAAVCLTLSLIVFAVVTWLVGEFTNQAREFELYFIATLMLVVLATCCIGVYKLMEISSKNTRRKRRPKNNWLNK